MTRKLSTRADGGFALFLLCLAAAPVLLGGNRTLAWSLLVLAVSVLLVKQQFACLRGKLKTVWNPRLAPPAIATAMVAIWIIFSLIPGVPFANPVWSEAERVLGRELHAVISINPGATVAAFVRLASYIGVFWLAVQFGRDPRSAIAILRWIGICGAVVAAYGIANYSMGNRHLLLFERWAGFGDVTGTFVNRNHFATYAGLCALANAGMATISYRKRWINAAYLANPALRALSAFSGKPAAYFLAASICIMGLFQSHSRMGMVAFIIGILFAVALLAALGYFKADRLLAGVVTGLLFTYLYASGLATLQRIGETGEIDRLPLFAMSLEAIGKVPWTGYGYGTFPDAILMHRPAGFGAGADITQAHNVYLELAVELGWPVTVVWLATLLWLFGCCLVGAFRRKRERMFPIVAASACVLVGVHSLTDFSMQIPAIAMTFATLLGLGIAQSWSNRAYFE